MDFFDMVPESFFSLLSSKNKRVYLKSILQVFKVYETGSILGIDKKIVVDDLVYFYETNPSLFFDPEDPLDEEANPKSKRELANYVLRRMEECGWIYVDVNNDYEEILNFTDTAITISECLLKAFPQFEYENDLPADYVNPNEYQGYIYSIYSLLNQKDSIEYALTFNLVYSNTKHLIRAIRRLDARMKEYISFVIEHSEIKDLMEKLITYKNDVYDPSYVKLKISDNINRYRLSIISNLLDMQSDEVKLKAISKNYTAITNNEDQAIAKAIRNIDEVIDAFNAIDGFINEIDNKNRNYVNSTIGKIKFLLSEEDNVIGKLNTILKYIKDSNKNDKLDKCMRLVGGLTELREQKVYSFENSLYSPRGAYARNYNQILDSVGFDFDLTDDFINQFKSAYNENYISSFLDSNMNNDILRASDIINEDCDDNTFMLVVYSVIFAVEKNYKVELCDNVIENKRYRIKDFIISKKEIY